MEPLIQDIGDNEYGRRIPDNQSWKITGWELLRYNMLWRMEYTQFFIAFPFPIIRRLLAGLWGGRSYCYAGLV